MPVAELSIQLRFYGSGYPGIAGRGVAGRGFPFFFWPVVFVGGGAGSGAYLHDTEVDVLHRRYPNHVMLIIGSFSMAIPRIAVDLEAQ